MLEITFVALFLGIFWAVAALASRLAEVAFGRDAGEVFARIATGALPLVILPPIAIVRVPTPHPALLVAALLIVSAILVFVIRAPLSPRRAWSVAALWIGPTAARLSALVVAGAAISATRLGVGAFTNESLPDNLQDLALFVIAVSLAAMAFEAFLEGGDPRRIQSGAA